ncbi:MAG: HlyD family efflux transporter periplasmic adaptor subunit [Oscillospiraceae bacterium]|nr:HlyD family efflux transporter periplasmic adaptor subunit [Oscillospiraceae bacterium]
METKVEGSQTDQIFAMHRSSRKRRRRKIVIITVVAAVVVVAALLIGIQLLQSRVNSQFGSGSSSEVSSAEVTTGSISSTVSGSGTLASQTVESVDIYSSLEVDEYYVSSGDSVDEDTLLATVTRASLLSAMSQVQAELDELDEELAQVSDDEASDTIAASLDGRVKAVFAQEGDDVATVMYEYGALMLLSLDGYLAVDVAWTDGAAGDSVTVTLSDGTEVTGTVEKNNAGTATVLLSDSAADYEDTVTVTDSDGNEVGEGTLYIHSQLAVTGYVGTVDAVDVSLDESVDAGDTLIELTDTSTSASYDALLKERSSLEEALNSLVVIYQEGGVYAPISGTVESLSESTDSGSSMAADASSASYTTIATIAGDESMEITLSVDESDILSLEVGQEAAVTIESIGEDAYTGSVTAISTAASSSSGVTAYSVTVTLDKTEEMLSGMSASVVITIEGVENALLIPVDALHQTSSTSYVYTSYDESTGELGGMVEVTTGLSNSSYVEITSGLEEGDTVYYTTSSAEESGMSDFSSMGGMDMGGMSGGDSSFDSSGMGGGNMGGDMPGMGG